MTGRNEEKQVFLDDESCGEVSLSTQFQAENAHTVTTKSNKSYSIYILILLTITYMVNQLDKFSLSVVAKPIAQELHYGNKACAVNNDVREQFIAKNHLTNDQISQWNNLCNK